MLNKLSMKNSWLNFLFICIFSVWSSLVMALDAPINIELDGSGEGYPLSIQPFSSEGQGLASPITPTVRSDLTVSGAFRFVDPASAKAVATGSVQSTGNGQYRVSFTLKNATQNILTSGQFVIRPQQSRDTAHTIADMIYRALTGFPGIFNSKIAYVRRQGRTYLLQVADVDGGRPQTILRSKEPIISPAWSPDGKKLAYVSFETEKPVVWVQDLSTGARRKLADFKGSNSAPAWSPDGTTLAVTLTTTGNSQIYLLNANGGTPKLITSSSAIDTEPTWTPDGQSIVFVSDRTGGPQIYRISANGGTPQRLTRQGSYNVSPKVSPDGKSFTYIRKEGARFRVMIQDFASGYARPLSESRYNERPSFAPNGQIVLYAEDIGGRSALYAATPSGSGRVKLSVIDGEIQDPAWGPVVE